ncbi:hypothetical protein [uncultured Sphingomonas sp.]|uniref:hypothetical protein n=1 Tax=uncultured Sphingomonas sp. TaxID=158754 RepID=UPI002637A745|nr:hypothetical protein [uncultured Sphingomonas sp.]
MTILVHDRASAARALTLPLPPPMRAALVAEIALLTSGEHDLTDWTDILLVEPGDDEAAVAAEAGFSPLVDPLSGTRHGQPGFEPGWDWLSRHDGYGRLVFTMGSTHATIIIVPDDADLALLALFR